MGFLSGHPLLRQAALTCLGIAATLSPPGTTLEGANSKWEYRWYNKSMLEATDKNYNLESTDAATGLTLLTPSVDRTQYLSTYVDASFKLSNDLTKRTILDLSDSLRFQYYALEDYDAIDEDSYKYRYTNNVLLGTLGHSFDKFHSFKIDLEHGYYSLPAAPELDNHTFRGNLSLTKNFTQDFSATLYGEGKIGRYPDQNTDDFDESSVALNLYHYFPEVVRRVSVAPASKFNSSKLSREPEGFNYELVYDYNSVYSEEARGYDQPPEVYMTEVARGDFYLSFDTDWDNRRLINSTGESYVQGAYTVTAGYNINDYSNVKFSDTWIDQNYEAESELLLNFSNNNNTFTAAYNATIGQYFNFNLTYSTAYWLHKNFSNQDYTLQTSSVDFDYHPNRLSYFLSLVWENRDYKSERLYYPSSFKEYATFILRYALTSAINFKFRDDYSKLDYGAFEDSVYASNKQNIYTISMDVSPWKHHTFEVGYYFLKELNRTFIVNDVTERTAFFNWQSNF